MNDNNFEIRLKKARQRLDIDNRIRIGAFIIATFLAAIFYAGMSFAPDSGWYRAVSQPILSLLLVLVIVILITTVLKFFFIASYNRVVKLHNEGKI